MKIVNIRTLFVRRIHAVANLPDNFSKQFNHYNAEIILDPWVACVCVCLCVVVRFPVRGLEELVGGCAVDLFTYVTAHITPFCVPDGPSALSGAHRWLKPKVLDADCSQTSFTLSVTVLARAIGSGLGIKYQVFCIKIFEKSSVKELENLH